MSHARPTRLLLTLGLLVAGPGIAPPAAASEPMEEPEKDVFALIRVTDALWRYSAGTYHGVLLVTDEGVVVTDPLSAEAATWLRKEIRRRFRQPIRYVLYSHSHPDHAYGGQALDGPGVVFVAHALAERAWVRTRAQVRMPDLTFADRLTVHLGGHDVELRYHGPDNGRGSVSMRFVQEDVLHVVDWIVVGRLPYRTLPGYDLHGTMDATEQALALPFSVFVGGHAGIGDRDGVRRYMRYLQALHDQVLNGILAGHDLPTIQREVDLSEFADLGMYDAWRDENIAGAWRLLMDGDYLDMRPEVPQER